MAVSKVLILIFAIVKGFNRGCFKNLPTRLHRGQRRQCGGFGAQHARPQAYRGKTAARGGFDFAWGKTAFRADQQGDGRRLGAAVRAGWLARPGASVRRTPRRCRLAQPVVQGQDGRDFGHAVAAALFAGGNDDLLPVPHALFRPFPAQLDDAAFAGQRLDGGDAEFHGFLQGEIHFVAAGNAPEPG